MSIVECRKEEVSGNIGLLSVAEDPCCMSEMVKWSRRNIVAGLRNGHVPPVDQCDCSSAHLPAVSRVWRCCINSHLSSRKGARSVVGKAKSRT